MPALLDYSYQHTPHSVVFNWRPPPPSRCTSYNCPLGGWAWSLARDSDQVIRHNTRLGLTHCFVPYI